jgi:hypothetical protein
MKYIFGPNALLVRSPARGLLVMMLFGISVRVKFLTKTHMHDYVLPRVLLSRSSPP